MSEARTPPYPVTAGDLIGGKYRIDSVIGEGGMGVVFAATHVDLHCTVALKVIRPEYDNQPELVARLMLEARAAAQIRSEHVCRVLDVSRLESGIPYVVMEHLEGKNLAMLLDAKGRLSERQAVDYVLQACEALAEAHRIGIIHRDLKPENLFLSEFPDGRRAIKVLDFGISKMIGQLVAPATRVLTNPSAAMGSPHYMAPEQMAASRDVDARTDIWALGAILHELVTGQLAFDGNSLPAVCAAVLQSNPVPVRNCLDDLSPGLEQTILACLVKDRDHRLGSVTELAQRLAPYGSASSAQSVARIIRLTGHDGNGPDTTGDSTGTLMSPRQLPTPRTPVRATSPTTQAVTSSKQSFTASSAVANGRRLRRFVVLGLLSIVSGLALVSLVRVTHHPPATPAAALPQGQLVSLAGNTITAAIPAPQPSAPLVTASAVPSSMETEKSADEQRAVGATAPPSAATSVAARRRNFAPETTPVHTTTVVRSRKAGVAGDPHSPDEFGGRR
jgi:serine/threonine protein kinase